MFIDNIGKVATRFGDVLSRVLRIVIIIANSMKALWHILCTYANM